MESLMQQIEEHYQSGTAEMLPGTKKFDGQGYVVTVQCSQCNARHFLAFAGWSSIVCSINDGGCGAELTRGQYRRS